MVAYELILAGCTLAGPIVGYGGYLTITGKGMDDSLSAKNTAVCAALLKQLAPKVKAWANTVSSAPVEEGHIPSEEELKQIQRWSGLWGEWNRHGSRMNDWMTGVGFYLLLDGIGALVILSTFGIAELSPGEASFVGFLGAYVLTFPTIALVARMRNYSHCRQEILQKAEDLQMGNLPFSESDLAPD